MTELTTPEFWVKTRLGDFSNLINGYAFKSKDYSENGDFVIRIGNVQDGAIVLNNPAYINSQALGLERFKLCDGDLLMSLTGNVGRVGVIKEKHLPAVLNQRVAKLEPIANDSISQSWLFHGLRSPLFHDSLLKKAKGAAQLNISGKDVLEQSLPLPSLPEQREIAARIDGLLAQVDSIKTRLDAIPGILKKFRQSVLAAAVSGRLTEEWRQSNPEESTAKMLEGFQPLPKPSRYKSRSTAFIKGVNAIAVGKPPKCNVVSWLWVPIVDIAKMESGHTPSRSKPEYWEKGDVPWIGIKDARENHSSTITNTFQYTNELGLANSASRLLPKNTVCISRTASVGYVVKMGIPMATSQDFVNWIPTKVVNPDWFMWLFVAEKESLFRFGKGSTHTTVYFPEWLSMHIALPPILEQIEIVKKIEQLFTFADQIEERVKVAQSRVNNLTQSILAKAFRGDLTAEWREQNQDLITGENSAQALLEKIKAEMEKLKPAKKIRKKKAS